MFERGPRKANMTDALPSDSIQGKPEPTSEDRAPPTTKDFGSTAKDASASKSRDLSNGYATNPSDVENPPQTLSRTEVRHIVTCPIASFQLVSNRDSIIMQKSARTFRATDKV